MRTNITHPEEKRTLARTKAAVVVLLLLASTYGVLAQNNPVPQSLPYMQDFSALKGTTTGDTLGTVLSYPVGWQGWAVSNASPSSTGRTAAPIADKLLKVGDATRGSSGCYDYEGKIGLVGANATAGDIALCLSVNTTGSNNIKVTFDAMTVRCLWDGTTAQSRKNGLVLQFRVGETGLFTPLTYLPAEYNTGTTANLTGTTGINPVTGLYAILPAACDNQPVVQIRWLYRHMDATGAAGSRPSVAIDNISVMKDVAVSNNANLQSLSVDAKADNNFAPLMLFSADKLQYNYYLTKNNPVPVVAAELVSGVATKVITQVSKLDGTEQERTAVVEVTAEDKTTKKTYSILFTETDNIFMSGLYSANQNNSPVGWSSSSMYFASSLVDGNNKYEGANYARCLSAATSSSLRLPVTMSVGILRFYAKKINDQVAGNIKVSTKIDAGEWTMVQDLGDITNSTYQEMSVNVNQTGKDSLFVRIEISKNGDIVSSAGYYIDDISYSEAAATSVFHVNQNIQLITEGSNLVISGAFNSTIRVTALNGQQILKKVVSSDHEIISLRKGIYIISVDEFRNKVMIY
jgi:hypothetical protein